MSAEIAELTRISRGDAWRREFIRKNNARCHYCNRQGTVDQGPDERPWHIDHMHPVARGGSDTEDNLTLACKRCNLAKGVKAYKQFAAFARAALWVPDGWRASEHELDRLMDLYQTVHAEYVDAVEDPSWRSDFEAGRIVNVGAEYMNGGFVCSIIELAPSLKEEIDFGLGRGKPIGRSVLELVETMHRLLPAMVTEIRMLRGETVEASTESGGQL